MTNQQEAARQKYEGKIFSSRVSGKFKVLKYHDKKHIDIEFLDTGYRKTIHPTETKRGVMQDPLRKSVYGIGFIGIGNYLRYGKGGMSPVYTCWHGMLDRCYRESKIHDQSYKNKIAVCEDWRNFQIFAKWYNENYPLNTKGKRRYQLDKDLLLKGNTTYSPDTCCFLPLEINSALVSKKGYWVDYNGKYLVNVMQNSKRVCRGRYKTKEEAIQVYKEYRLPYLKELAEKYKDTISKQSYDALYNFKIE